MKTNTLNKVPRVRNRIGMTLIEIVVVISIIAILAGMLIPVIGAVRRRGQVTATVLEIQNLKNAIEQYKQKFGDYPPDGSNSLVLERHIRIAFPRIHTTEIKFLRTELGIDLDSNNNVIPKNTGLDPAEALVFFLGGFSDDPRYPFQGKGGPANLNRNPGLFDFDPNRLTDDGDGFAVYHPRGSDVPFVYFDSRTYMPRRIYGNANGNAPAAQYPLAVTSNDNGVARPYRSDQPRQVLFDNQGNVIEDGYEYKWVNSNTFQIIAAGTTNHYGNDLINCKHGHVIERARYCPICDHDPPQPIPNWKNRPYFFHHYNSGGYYSEGDNSNITSFSRGTLEDDIP